MSLKYHSLLNVSASRGHHQATISWRKSLHCMGSHVNINKLLLHVVVFENVHSHFPHAIFMCGIHVVFLVCGFPRSGMCPLYYKRDTYVTYITYIMVTSPSWHAPCVHGPCSSNKSMAVLPLHLIWVICY
jgi:hypothetical protein